MASKLQESFARWYDHPRSGRIVNGQELRAPLTAANVWPYAPGPTTFAKFAHRNAHMFCGEAVLT